VTGSGVLSGGEVLLVGVDVLVAEQGLRAAIDAQRRNGLPVRSEVAGLHGLLEVAAARVRGSAGFGSAAVPFEADGAASSPEDLIDVREAAVLLGCKVRNVRDLCGRGVFGSARLLSGRWAVDRVEVESRAMGRSA
jgi:hypothetical protein